MATATTPEEAARQVLRVFQKFNTQPGGAIEGGAFLGPFSSLGWTADDLRAGMEYALQQGWIRHVGPDAITLTKAGFAEIADA
jgi:hypothetical protein